MYQWKEEMGEEGEGERHVKTGVCLMRGRTPEKVSQETKKKSESERKERVRSERED